MDRVLKGNMPETSSKSLTHELALFKSLYFTPGKPSSFGGKTKFLDAVRKTKGFSKSRMNRAKQWINSVETYSLHRQAATGKTKNRRPIIVTGIDSTWEIDLSDLSKFRQANDGKRYVLFVIDVFSRFAWIRILKDKAGSTVTSAMEDIFRSSNRMPKYINSDLGKEFYNKQFKQLLRSHNIHHYHTENRDIKASIVERLQRTIKDKLYRYFTHSSKHRYIEVLPQLVGAYNNSNHSALDIAPSEVTLINQEEVWNQQHHADLEMYNPKLHSNRLNIGDTVRVSKIRSTFEKGSLAKWTDELFIVDKVLSTFPSTYSLVDMNSKSIAGTWYSWELQKAPKPRVYKIEEVLRKKKINGKWKYFVKFLGYDSSFNEWVDNIVEHKN